MAIPGIRRTLRSIQSTSRSTTGTPTSTDCTNESASPGRERAAEILASRGEASTPGESGRHWATPTVAALPDWFKRPEDWSELSVQERLDALDRGGLIYRSREGKPRFKRYLSISKGTAVADVVTDIPPLSAAAKERLGYPTQKPLKLPDRIIESSSNRGDIVLDPFCGCATVLASAELNQRRWVGIDVSPKAADLVCVWLDTAEVGALAAKNVIHRTDIPKRTDLGKLPRYNSAENRKLLYGEQGGDCNGCGTHFAPQHLEVDHIIARRQGGTNHLENLQLLCGSCNRIKGDRGMEYLRTKLALDA